MTDEELLAYSDGSYSTSDWGCVGDTIAISPRPFPVPGFLRMYTSWARALQEATDTCALQQGHAGCSRLRRSEFAVGSVPTASALPASSLELRARPSRDLVLSAVVEIWVHAPHFPTWFGAKSKLLGDLLRS